MDIERENLLTHLRQIDEYKFEDFVAKLWERYGWKTEVTSGSNDRGIDVIAEKSRPFHQKHLVQVKRWGSDNKVGGPEIQQYSSLRHRRSDIDAVVVVTTSSFSRQAKEEARDLNVKLVDGSDLYDIISEVGTEGLINEYTAFGRPSSDVKSGTTSDSEESSESDSVECRYCKGTFQNEFDIRKHLCEEHDRTQLSRIDRKRAELYRESGNSE